MQWSNALLLQLTVTVGGPGLPVVLSDESYFCHLADSEGRFTINVSAVEVTANAEYTCDITNQVPNFDGVQAGNYYQKCFHYIMYSFFSLVINFSFVRLTSWHPI